MNTFSITGLVCRIFVLIVLVPIFTGCVSLPQTEPFFKSDNYNPKQKQTIVLLPAINIGVQNGLNTELNREKFIRKVVIDRGYTFVGKTKLELPLTVTSSTLDNLDFKWVGKLALEPGVWVMVVVVDYLNKSVVFTNARGDAYVTGYLVEYPSGNLLWESVGYGMYKIGFLYAGLVDGGALGMATVDLMKSLPPLNGPIDPNVGYEPLPQHRVFNAKDKIEGGCVDNACNSPNGQSNICVRRDKSTAYFDEVDEFDEDNFVSLTKDTKYPLYDRANLIAEDIRGGQYVCWSRNPGKTFIHFMGSKPAFFRAKPGYKYYINAKYNWGMSGGWEVEGMDPTAGESNLVNYKPTQKRVNLDKVNID